MANRAKVPKSLQPILWSQDVSSLDIKKNKEYIIHQVLRYGSLQNIRWLFKTYDEKEIVNVFAHKPLPIYTPSSLKFTKNILLNINKKIDDNKYLKSFTSGL